MQNYMCAAHNYSGSTPCMGCMAENMREESGVRVIEQPKEPPAWFKDVFNKALQKAHDQRNAGATKLSRKLRRKKGKKK